ncbi:MAG: transporter substrate-binding domain-containing protein [Breznakibacter sp.]
MKRSYYWIAILPLLWTMQSCNWLTKLTGSEDEEKTIAIDLEEIRQQGKLKVAIDYNSTNYFIYKGKPMGYQLELLQELCNFLSLKLEVTVSNDVEKNFDNLLSGEIDLIATNLTVTNDHATQVNFTEPHCYTRQVLVQRKYNRDEKSGRHKGFNELIRNQLDLAGKTIYVQKNTTYFQRLKTLSNEIGDSIHIIEIPDYESEQLIGLVSTGEIEYTVCDENLARVNLNFYPNLDIETAISFPQKIAWAVRPSSPHLLEAVNNWMIGFKKTARYEKIYQKYFLNKRSIHLTDISFNSLKGGQVSVYDDLIKAECKGMAWDWRLVASLIYQESRFSNAAESWAGAQGLMQLMPETAENFGVMDVYSPEQNIKGGVKFLKWLDERLSQRVEDPDERQKFVLAAYNVGIGHVLDAIKLAEKNGKNPKIWESNVDYYLLNKSNPEFYNDPVVKFGFCRGEEPYLYVKEIMERYEHYKNVMKH